VAHHEGIPHLGAEEIGLFDTIIERHQPVTDRARWGLPTMMLKRRSKVSRAYEALVDEVIHRLDARAREISR